MTPTTDDLDRWQEHHNATKDAGGEPWTGQAAAFAALLIILAALAGCGVVAWMLAGGAL